MRGAHEKELEILRAAARLGPARFYAIYRESSTPLSTAWRAVRRLEAAGLLERRGDLLHVTGKGLLLLAAEGDVHAAVRLARLFGISAEEAAGLARFIRGSVDLWNIPLTDVGDIARAVPPEKFRRLKGTPLEAAAAKLLLASYPAVEVEGWGRYVVGPSGFVAARCGICGRHSLFVEDCRCVEMYSLALRRMARRLSASAEAPYIRPRATQSHAHKDNQAGPPEGRVPGGGPLGP